MTDHELIGKLARVTGAVKHGTIGEVMVNVRGGSEAYFALPADDEHEFDVGDRVFVTERGEGRLVYVAPYDS